MNTTPTPNKANQVMTDAEILSEAIEALRAFEGVEDFGGWHSKYSDAIVKARRALSDYREAHND